MAFQYFLYDTDYGNTIVDRSGTSFTPVPPYAELYTDYFIPETQPVYLYKVTGSTIVVNSQSEVENYLSATELPPTSEGNVTYGEFTGTTAILISTAITGATNLGGGNGNLFTSISGNKIQLKSISGGTNVTITCNGNYVTINSTGGGSTAWGSITGNITGQTDLNNCLNNRVLLSTYNTYVNTTAPSIFVNVSGDSMTGTLSTTSNLLANGAVTGSSVCGGVWVTSPLVCATTKVQSPIVTGSTCVTSPITCGLTRVQSPIVCGSTCSTSPITCGTTCVISPITIGSTCVCSPVVLGSTSICSPTICSSTCLCSTGTARFTGGITAASTLNVSGATKIVGVDACEIIFGNQTSCALTGNSSFLYNPTSCTLCVPFVKQTGSGAYFYTESTSIVTNATATCKIYLSGTPWNFQAGTYRIDINATVGNGSSNGCSLAKITCDGVSIAGSNYLLRSQTANFNFAVSMTRDMVFTAGCHCLAIYFWAGANTACVSYGAIRAVRIC